MRIPAHKCSFNHPESQRGVFPFGITGSRFLHHWHLNCRVFNHQRGILRAHPPVSGVFPQLAQPGWNEETQPSTAIGAKRQHSKEEDEYKCNAMTKKKRKKGRPPLTNMNVKSYQFISDRGEKGVPNNHGVESSWWSYTFHRFINRLWTTGTSGACSWQLNAKT